MRVGFKNFFVLCLVQFLALDISKVAPYFTTSSSRGRNDGVFAKLLAQETISATVARENTRKVDIN